MSKASFDPLSLTDFIDAFGSIVWSRGVGRRAEWHRGTPCPQRLSPSIPLPAVDAPRCPDECVSHWSEEVTLAHSKFVAARGWEMRDPAAWVSKVAGSTAFTEDLRRLRAGFEGRVQRPRRAVEAAWVVAVVPDPLDRELLLQLLFFVGSNDRTNAGREFPYDRWAAKLGLSEVDVTARTTRTLVELRRMNPDWVTAQIEVPMSRVLARSSAEPEVLTRGVSPATAAESDPIDLAHQALELMGEGMGELDAIVQAFGVEVRDRMLTRCSGGKAAVPGHVKVPVGGHESSPLMATSSPHVASVMSDEG